MTQPQARLCVFLRAPNLGQVKTRLAAKVGEPQALACHIRLVEHLLGQLVSAPSEAEAFAVELWLADMPNSPEACALVERWVERTGRPLQYQQGADLGARMSAAVASCLARGSYGLVVGSDCPTVDKDYVEAAIRKLQGGVDVVLGPAEDGGYGLIGLAQARPELFQRIDWGTDQVLGQTLDAARRSGLAVHQLATLWDVDYLADWNRFCSVYGGS